MHESIWFAMWCLLSYIAIIIVILLLCYKELRYALCRRLDRHEIKQKEDARAEVAKKH